MSHVSKKRRASNDSDEERSAVAPKASKKTKHGITSHGEDDEGNPFWELSEKRRVGISQFKSMSLINIREYYEKDGKTLPGKKGISLSVAQYITLLKAVPAINATLRQMGHAVEDIDDMSDVDMPADKPKKGSKPSKANIDMTSDEDEG